MLQNCNCPFCLHLPPPPKKKQRFSGRLLRTWPRNASQKYWVEGGQQADLFLELYFYVAPCPPPHLHLTGSATIEPSKTWLQGGIFQLHYVFLNVDDPMKPSIIFSVSKKGIEKLCKTVRKSQGFF